MHAPSLHLGQVMHRRLRPVGHAFTYPVFYVRLPLRALGSLDCGIFRVGRPGLLSFHEADHGPRDGSPLLPWICARLREQGLPDDGEIVLQTFPRVFGYVFNPVSFWFCHDRSGALIAILAEVNNTFGEHHAYLLHRQGQPLADGEVLTAEKCLHVSPFNDVRGGYRFRFHLARAKPLVRIDYDDGEGPLLITSISGQPQAWRAGHLLTALIRMPLLTLGVIWRIHWQALRLWLKGVPFHGTRPPSAATPTQETMQ